MKEIEEKVRKLNEEQGGFVNLMVWDSEKKNIDGKPIGEYIALMYRNILPNPDCLYSMVKMTPTAYKDEKGEPIDHVTDPENQLAHLALGRYGPIGTKSAPSYSWKPALMSYTCNKMIYVRQAALLV